jgi:O-antigen ligase
MRLLSALRPFGYPEGAGVLRYVLDDPAQLQRATGLWIDPNAFGGFLLVAGAITLPQAFAARPALPRLVVLGCLGLIGLALVLTVSRGAMIALGLVALLVGIAKYRRILPLIVIVLLAALALPQTRELIAHFADGFAARDLATQMRVGEYKDAFRLIERYPVFGVGFADTPDVDLYIGVSNMYLLIAQQMGLIGLAVFVATLLGFFTVGARAMRAALRDDAEAPVWLGAHGAVIGALMTGMVDHYFFNIDFHNSVMLFWIAVALAVATSTTISNHDAAKSESPEEDRHRHGLRPNGQRNRARI